MSNSSALASSDTWVLLATIYGGREKGANLQAIISAADYINHAILTYEELDGGLARLRSEGFIEEQDGIYYPTQAVLSAYDQTTKLRRSVSKEWDDLERFIKAHRPDTQSLVVSTPGQAITRTMYESAVQTYIQRSQYEPRSTKRTKRN